MAGGMTRRRGVPLQERPVAPPVGGGSAHRTHHCWVVDHDDRRWPGLVLEWRNQSDAWQALVVYVTTAAGPARTVQEWVSANRLSPVRV